MFRYNSEKMCMVEMESYEERNTLPKTKWNIPQPSMECERREALQTGTLYLMACWISGGFLSLKKFSASEKRFYDFLQS